MDATEGGVDSEVAKWPSTSSRPTGGTEGTLTVPRMAWHKYLPNYLT